jgi:hypothetical protein
MIKWTELQAMVETLEKKIISHFRCSKNYIAFWEHQKLFGILGAPISFSLTTVD